MVTRQHLFLLIVLACVVAFAGIAARYLWLARRTSRATWTRVLQRLHDVDRDNLAIVALDLVDEEGNRRQAGQSELTPEKIWELLGGLEGLEILGSNCDVLIDLAFHVQLWYPEALVVTEQLRLNAREIKWHIERLKGAAQTGNLKASFPMYAQSAAATYFLMTRNLLSLYEATHSPGLSELQATL